MRIPVLLLCLGVCTGCATEAGEPSSEIGTLDMSSQTDGAVRDALVRPNLDASNDAMTLRPDARLPSPDAALPTPDAALTDGPIACIEGSPCDSICGSTGQIICTQDVPMCEVPIESCTLQDDDCDGSVDEGFELVVYPEVPFAELQGFHLNCAGPGAQPVNCTLAARQWCRAQGACFQSGAALFPANAQSEAVVCFGAGSEEHTTTYADFNATLPPAWGQSSFGTMSLFAGRPLSKRFCKREVEGFPTGIGPVLFDLVGFTAACLPEAVAEEVLLPQAEFAILGCQLGDWLSTSCTRAADTYCKNHGFTAGFGPAIAGRNPEDGVEIVTVICLRGH